VQNNPSGTGYAFGTAATWNMPSRSITVTVTMTITTCASCTIFAEGSLETL
jgi:hypothetical protein